MGFSQTDTHRRGKHSYHQIGLVRGQFGDIPEDEWLDHIGSLGYDGWEEAAWAVISRETGLDVRKLNTDQLSGIRSAASPGGDPASRSASRRRARASCSSVGGSSGFPACAFSR